MTAPFISADALLVLRPHYQIVPIGATELYLYSTGSTSLHVRDAALDVPAFFQMLVEGTTLHALRFHYDDDGWKRANAIVSQLALMNALQGIVPPPPDLSPSELERFGRELTFLSQYETPTSTRFDCLRRIRAGHLLLLGMGTLASWALQHFALCGIGHVTVVDDDVVQLSNIARQPLFRETDIARRKVDAAADAVARLSSLTIVNAVATRITSTKDVLGTLEGGRKIDLIVLTADRPPWTIARWVAEAAQLRSTPMLRANRFGVGPLMIPALTSCPMCGWRRMLAAIPQADDLLLAQRDMHLSAPSGISTTAAMIATLLARETIVQLVSPEHVRTRDTVLLFENDCFRVEPYPRDIECPVCSVS